jgi:hypothetical protein
MNDQEPALPTRPLDIKSPLWEAMDRQPRHVADAALRFAVPKEIAGVYAWYRNGHAVYVGKGDDLYDRISRRHMAGAARSTPRPYAVTSPSTWASDRPRTSTTR